MADPGFQGPTGQFDRARFEELPAQAGYYGAALRRRAAPADTAPQIVGPVTGDLVPKAWLDSGQSVQNQQRSIEYVRARTGPGRRIPQPTPRAQQVFRRAQGHVPRARVPQGRHRRRHARRTRAMDRRFPTPTSNALTTSTEAATPPPSAGTSSRSCSRTWRRRRPPARGSKAGIRFEALAAERGLEGQGHRPRHGDQIGDHRSGRR